MEFSTLLGKEFSSLYEFVTLRKGICIYVCMYEEGYILYACICFFRMILDSIEIV